MYRRNYLYISDKNQRKIANCRILIGGCGLGSVIAECALRLGFENICIVDGDKVELSNLNRQNYTRNDIGRFKVNALQSRLLNINPHAKIKAIRKFLTKDNINDYINIGFDIAINTIDFTSDIPFLFDEICCRNKIPILHPLNLGWGASVIVINQHSRRLSELQQEYQGFELRMAQHILDKLKQENRIPKYLTNTVKQYTQIMKPGVSPPQLSTGSWLVASMCTTIMYQLCLKQSTKIMPEIYFETV
jgi:molybdopterin/thiamine biosynthesis adenylyltransferase